MKGGFYGNNGEGGHKKRWQQIVSLCLLKRGGRCVTNYVQIVVICYQTPQPDAPIVGGRSRLITVPVEDLILTAKMTSYTHWRMTFIRSLEYGLVRGYISMLQIHNEPGQEAHETVTQTIDEPDLDFDAARGDVVSMIQVHPNVPRLDPVEGYEWHRMPDQVSV